MGTLRAATILAGFAGLTVPLMPVQALLLRFSPGSARRFPHWYHRQVCRLFGIRLTIEGEVMSGRPVLLVANHTSWLDIPVLSAVAPLSFVAKKEVMGWPFVSALARLQRSVYVDRERRGTVRQTANDMVARLEAGDTLLLFAEATSSDGNRVLPFKTSLFGAAKPPAKADAPASSAVVQTVSLVYTRLHGIPFGRADRHLTGFYGDMEMQGHAWQLLKAGPLDVHIKIGSPVPLDSFADRKDLALRSETEVRENVVRILRARPEAEALEVSAPSEEQRKAVRRPGSSKMWQ
jgi:1-acyl-sn-glycerol-3-phosphate acyltransferase